MFGAISSNKDTLAVFIAMLRSLRFTFDHEELVSIKSSLIFLQEFVLCYDYTQSGVSMLTFEVQNPADQF